MAARLLWNPNLDYRDLVAEFCAGYYGPAGPAVVDYIDLLHQSLLASGDRISAKQRITSDYLGLDFIVQADQLMASAEAAAAGDYSRHVHEVRLGVDMTILLREHMYAAEAEETGIPWVHDPLRRARFEQYAAEAGIIDYAEDGTIDELYAALDINRVNPPVPDVVPTDHQWIDFQDMDLTICCGASLVEDPYASDHGAVAKGPGSDWAIQMSLDMLPPEGEWILYAYVRAELNPGADPSGIALNMGIYPGDYLEIPGTAFPENQYVVYEFPGSPVHYQTGRAIWFSSGDVSDMIHVDRVVAVNTAASGGSSSPLPYAFRLEQNFPNPFNPSTTIRFSLPKDQPVDLEVFDVRGRRVVSLLDHEPLAAGWHDVVWRGRDANGRPAASGVYYYRLTAGRDSRSNKLLLLK